MGVQQLTEKQVSDLHTLLKVHAGFGAVISKENHVRDADFEYNGAGRWVADAFDHGVDAGRQELAQRILAHYFGEQTDEPS